MADLDKDRIAAAAMAVADERGLAGFTMRAVAEVLGVTPMALYHHVQDKAALAALVVDAANSERPLPPATGDWREDVWAMARWTRESAMLHPRLAQVRRAHQVWTPASLGISERWVNLWRQSGLDQGRAVLAASASSMVIVGVVEREQVLDEMTPPDADQLSRLPNARMMFEIRHDRAAEFELIVRSFIDGLHAKLMREGQPT